jgi:hypothetical protein
MPLLKTLSKYAVFCIIYYIAVKKSKRKNETSKAMNKKYILLHFDGTGYYL